MEKKSILAIVVTYNIGKEYFENFKSLEPQVGRIIIIDNNSDKETKEVLNEIEKEYKEKVKIVYNSENKGLATAQNIGLEFAKEKNMEWVLLLDNDSQLDKEMIEKMSVEYDKYVSKKDIGIISPLIIDKNSNKQTKYICKEGILGIKRKVIEKDSADNVLCTIASGSLIKTELIKKIGNFKDEYFIDSIDTEFCMRTISKGYKILVVKNAKLYHELGEKKDYKILNFSLTPTNHSPLRRYYMYRNRVKMWKEYWKKTPKYIIYEIFASFYQFMLIISLEKNKKEKIKMIFKGICDGIKN